MPTKEEVGGGGVTIALQTIVATKAAVGGGDIIVLGNVTVPTGAIAMIGLTVATTVGVELARYR